MLPPPPIPTSKMAGPDQTVRIFVAQNMATIRRNIGFTTESLADHAVVARGIFVEKSGRLKSPRILWRSLGETAGNFRNADKIERNRITCRLSDTIGVYHRQASAALSARLKEHSVIA
jgi:hypothetical protein